MEPAADEFSTGRLASLAQRHRLGLVYLFGSEAKAGVTLLSGGAVERPDDLADLDVGVVTVDPLPPARERIRLYSSLHNDLQELFRAFRVDLVLLEEGHSVFQCEAVRGFCVYQASEAVRDSYELRVLRRAADFAPVLRAFNREVLEEV